MIYRDSLQTAAAPEAARICGERSAVTAGARFPNIGSPVLVSTFGRSGTHLVIDLIRRHFRDFRSWKLPGERTEHLYTELGLAVRHGEPAWLTRSRLTRPARPLVKTHEWHTILADPALRRAPLVQAIRRHGTVIEVIRDPRGAIASWWQLATAEALHEGRRLDVTLDEYIERRAHEWVRHVDHAHAGAPQLILRFRDLFADPPAALARIADVIGAEAAWRSPVLPPPCKTLTSARLARLLQLRPPSTAVIVNAEVRKRCQFEWTPARMTRLRAIVGEQAAVLGYHF